MAQQKETQSPADKTARSVAVELTDGSRLLGTLPVDTVFPVQSTNLKAGIAIKWIDTVTMSEDQKAAVIVMQNGDRIEGSLQMKPLPLAMKIGKVPVDLRFVKTITVIAGYDSVDGLVFWNTLASEKEAFNSKVGPALAPYADAGGLEVAGQREFITGDHGGAVTLKGVYGSVSRVHNLVLDNLQKLINPEQGCIEFWYCQVSHPVGYQYGVYRMFDGDYGLGSCVQFFTGEGLNFALDCGGVRQVVNVPMQQVPNKEWIHLAATWNRKGLEGTQETIRIYLNGKKVASSTAANWGAAASGKADICGGQDAECAGKFLMNNLKIWNRSKTNFAPGVKPSIDPKKLPTPQPPAPSPRPKIGAEPAVHPVPLQK